MNTSMTNLPLFQTKEPKEPSKDESVLGAVERLGGVPADDEIALAELRVRIEPKNPAIAKGLLEGAKGNEKITAFIKNEILKDLEK